ncbi:hypothetical protein M2108_000011 [Paenibacillus sp. PastM-3]|nr:hypothetical protein [Paenibacillus sp. PastM-2]MDH6483649.1 hypothetical protein [Paenibacillus sp. PastH-2]MDH6505059.1 hypothetical protein [Paenibacillus sp. PastM-3]
MVSQKNEGLSLMFMFGMFIIDLLNYLKKK